MPRPRKYESNAARQAAHRERRKEREELERKESRAVENEAALLCAAFGLPCESRAALIESLRRLREGTEAALKAGANGRMSAEIAPPSAREPDLTSPGSPDGRPSRVVETSC